jgi:predicted RNA binding protein YcfA (HicA-like mRNA interferase family)
MSERLPRVTAREIIRVLERRGFALTRSSGSHHIFKNAAGKRTTVPVHAGKTLHPKILQNILRDAELSVGELKKGL